MYFFMKKGIAEFIGTYILVFVGTGAAVLGGGAEGIVGIAGIALAFGLTIVAAAYSIGTVSGAHLNPAVSIAMWMNKRISVTELVYYIVGQVVGAFAASLTLSGLLDSAGKSVENLGQNVFEMGTVGALSVEIILTFIFVLVIMTVTSQTKGNSSLAGLVIGLSLTLIHFVGIPLTGMSANPARSLAPAVLVGGQALEQVWVFIVAPIVGGILAALVAKYLLNTENDSVEA
ncbi:aquaporin [Enterococcus thailandicus]|uniref:Aquaporin n=3 Tax=root TaxID=1 RepID=A0A510WER6_ENTTH|nr:aquaporin Z [Enterococcus sp. 5B7_DIV0075]GEK37669.1 aquaporin [Enterococcus thailandicus]GMC01489.1 aquaporin [Enterococcus thailandicus]GMC03029.1 aquaporin [Enterococcus thailandicus]GMC09135.1 aquaporin [Enterococcus thailandicus]